MYNLSRKIIIALFALAVAAGVLPSFAPIQAATGINKTINFQGKVVNSDGTNVADNTYDFVIKTYDGPGSAASNTFTENWTAATLFSQTINNTPPVAGTDGNITYPSSTNDSTLHVGQILTNTTKGESVYITSINTGTKTIGISATRQTWVNGDAITNKIYVKDGIFRVVINSLNQDLSGVNFNTDSIFFGVNFNGDGEMKPRVKFSATPYAFNADQVNGLGVTNSSGNLTIAPNASGTVQLTTNGNGNGLTLTTADGSSGNSGGLTLLTGNASGNTSGSISVDVGGTATTKGTITIGTTNASALTIGNTGATLTLNGSNATLSSGGAFVAVGVNSGSGLLQGTGGLTLTGTTAINTSGSSNTSIGTGSNSGTVTLGNSSGHVDLTLGSDATGDLFYRDSSGHIARLGVGSSSQVLIGGTTPAWGSVGSASCSTCLTTAGSQTVATTGGDGTTVDTFNVTNSNSGGSAAQVNGLTFGVTGHSTSGGVNTNNALNFSTISAIANNTFNGIFFPASNNYTNYLKTPSIVIDGSGNISGAGTINGATITATTFNTATISGGTLSGGSLSGGTYTGTTIAGTGSFTLTGGTGSGDTLTLISSSNGTKGDINFFSTSNKLTSAGALTIAGALSASNVSGTTSGTNTGDQDLSGYVPTSRTVNGKALSSNITLSLASADFANQGTTTTVLHGNGSGNPSFGAVVTADITDANVTLAKMANMTTASFLGRNTAGSGVPEVLSASTAKSILAIANTDVSGLGTMSTQNASAVAITGGTAVGLTGLAVRDTSAAYDVTIAGTSTTASLTAGRTLTLDVGNVAHTLAFGTTANTITFPSAASYTLLASNGSIAGLTGTISSTVLGNSNVFIGTTSIALNRTSASQSLTGITSIDGTAAGLTAQYIDWSSGSGGNSIANKPTLGTISSQAASNVAITGGTIAGLTGLAIRDTSAAYDVTLAAASSTNLSAGRTLTLDMGNVAHTLAFGTTANTITFPSAASYTVAGLSVANAFTAAQSITAQSITAFTVARTGSTYALQVDTNTTNSVTGLKLTAGASGGGFAAAVIGGGTDEALTIDAKAAGVLTIAGTSTGTLTLGNSSTTATKLGKFTTANQVLYISATDGTLSGVTVNAGGTQCLTQASSGAPGWGSCSVGGSGTVSSGTSGQLAFYTGTTTVGSETSGFGWDTSNKLFTLTGGSSNTGQTTQVITSSAQGLTSGGLLSAALTSSSATAAYTGNIGSFSATRTNATNSQSLTDSGNILALTRSEIVNATTPTTTVSGNVLNISDTGTATNGTITWTGATAALTRNCTGAGTCTDTGSVLSLTQSYATASGPVLNVANSGTGSSAIIGGVPNGSNTSALVRLGNTAISGGNANGAYLGLNAAASYAGDFLDFQQNNIKIYQQTSVANAVNGLKWTFTATGSNPTNAPTLAMQGSDTDIGLIFNPKGAGTFTVNSGVTTGTGTTAGINLTSSSVTQGNLVDINTASNNSFTTGKLLNISSAATTLTTGTLVNSSYSSTAAWTGNLNVFDYSPSSNPGTAASGDLFRINLGANATGTTTFTGNLFNIIDNTSSLFSISKVALTSSLPFNETAPGDVSIAYDINLTNPTASFIKSAAPLVIQAGETFNSSNLTLKTFTQGTVVFDESGVTTGTAVDMTNFGITTGTGLNLQANSLTTGNAINLSSTSTTLTTGSLLSISTATTGAVATNGVVSISSTGAYTSTSNVGLLNVSASALTGTGTVVNIAASNANQVSNTLLNIAQTGVGAGYTGTVSVISTTETTGNGAKLLDLQANSMTIGTVLNMSSLAALTSGIALNISASGTSYTGDLGKIELTGNSGSALTGNALKVGITGTSASGNSVALNVTNGNTGATAYVARFNTDGTYTDASATVIDGTGKMGVGIVTPSYRLDVRDSQATNYVMRVMNTSTTSTEKGLLIDLGVAAASRTTSTRFIDFATSGTVAGKIQGGASAVVYTTTGADYAEYFHDAEVNNQAQSGEVVSFGGDTASVKKSSSASDQKSLGIVSTSPGFIGHGPSCRVDDPNCDYNYSQGNTLVALSGQVPLKVTTENGPIEMGDFLTSSSTPGVAMKATKPGQMIARALENYSGQGQGTITVLVYNGFADPQNVLSNLTVDKNGLSPQYLTQDQLPKIVQQAAIDAAKISGGVTIDQFNNLADRVKTLEDLLSSKNPVGTNEASNSANLIAQAPVVAGNLSDAVASSSASLNKLSSDINDLLGSMNINSSSSANLASFEATSSGGLRVDSVEVAGIATVSGQLQVKGGGLFDGIAKFVSGIAEFIGTSIFKGDSLFVGRATFNNDTTGQALIAQGQDNVNVTFSKEYKNPANINVSINLDQVERGAGESEASYSVRLQAQQSAENSILSGNLKYIVTSRSKTGFTIKLSAKAPVDIKFSWTALANNDLVDLQNLDAQVSPNQSPVPSPSFSPPSASSSQQNSGQARPVATSTPTPVPVKQITINRNELGFLRVRQEPNINAPEIGQVDPGLTFTVVEESGLDQKSDKIWYQIELKPGQFGWVLGAYVTVEKSS